MVDPVAHVLEAVAELTDPLLDELAALVRIPSVSGTDAESEAQAHLAGRLAHAGLDVDYWPIDLAALRAHSDFPGMEVDRREAWGLVGRLPGAGDGATLMLNGDGDVVRVGDPDTWTGPPFSAGIRAGCLHGRGSCDMKAGLMASLWAAQGLRVAGVRMRGDVVLAAVQGEEDGGLGTFATLQRGWRADACVIAEPTGLDVVPANSGSLTFRLRIRGRATHAARRTDGVSAIETFWPVWRALADLEGRLGVAIGESTEHARADLEDAIADACERDPWLRGHPVEVEWWGGQFASGGIPAGSDLVDRVQAAHCVAAHGRPQDVYGSDLRLLTGLAGIPTLQYGPGNARLAHAPNEAVPLAEVVTTARTLALVALDVCGTL